MTFEGRHRAKDGRLFPVEVNTNYIEYKGRFLGISFARDITERKQAEKALHEEAVRRKILIDQSRDGIVILSENGSVYEANKRYAEMLGYTPEEVSQLHIWDWDTQWTRDQVIEMFQQVDEKGDRFETRHRRKDGTFFDVEISTNGAVIGGQKLVFCVCRDITDRKRSEESLLQSEVRARAQRSAIASLTLDKGVLEEDLSTSLERITKTVATTMNTARASVWTLSEDNSELCCLSLFEAGPNRHSSGMVLKTATFPSYFEALLQDSRIFANDAQTDSRTSELSEGYLAPRGITSMIDAGILLEGRLAGVVSLEHIGAPRQWHSDEEAFVSAMAALVAQIMTNDRRKKAEAEKEKLQAMLLQAQKMESVGILAGGVAHDFNNLLHIMRGSFDLLADSENLDAVRVTRLQTVVKSLDRAAQLVQQLLLFSRKAEIKRLQLNVNQEVQDVARILERTIPRMIELELHLDPALWPVSGDPVQIEQVLLNLANNAADAMPEGGRLTIETANVEVDEGFVRVHAGSTSGRHVLLTVSDTGCGMDKKTLDNVFDPFFTTKEVGKGTGLGLASAYGIVKAHEGYIHCSSEVGSGTTFRIYLPAADRADMAIVESQPEAPLQGGNETILVVDDEPEIQELTQESLESFGYNVQTAATGEEALEMYKAEGKAIDLVLLDLNMPGMGGYRCLHELIQLDPTVRVLIASGYTTKVHEKDIRNPEAMRFLHKPYQLKELAAMVREVLDEKTKEMRPE
ncbi:MAG TPA: PAS domain S-box protein, partial [Desulfonatronum sp.]|nr:PAS domain S-box protein [Desulfonatronum sp.]